MERSKINGIKPQEIHHFIHSSISPFSGGKELKKYTTIYTNTVGIIHHYIKEWKLLKILIRKEANGYG